MEHLSLSPTKLEKGKHAKTDRNKSLAGLNLFQKRSGIQESFYKPSRSLKYNSMMNHEQLKDFRASLITLKEENEVLEDDANSGTSSKFKEITPNESLNLNQRRSMEIISNLNKFIDSKNGITEYFRSKKLSLRHKNEVPVDLTLRNYKKSKASMKVHRRPKRKKRKTKDIDSLIVKTDISSYNKCSFSSFTQSFNNSSHKIKSVYLKKKSKFRSFHQRQKVQKKPNARISSDRSFQVVKPKMNVKLTGSKRDLSFLLGNAGDDNQGINFKKRKFSSPITLNVVLNQTEDLGSRNKKKRKVIRKSRNKETKC